MNEEKKIDWAKIKGEYVTSDISLVKIAEKYGVSPSAVQKRSKKEGWSVDKKKQHKKAADKVAKKLNDKKVRKAVSDIDRVCNAASKLISKINRAIDEVDKREIQSKTCYRERAEGKQTVTKTKKGTKENFTETVTEEVEISEKLGLVDTKNIAEIAKSLLNIKQVLEGTESKNEEQTINIIELPTMQLLTPPEEEFLNDEN